jgi:hypothetical protein
MCEDISIADDFDVWLGVVSGGVSLLIRPAETNPMSPDIFQMSVRAVERASEIFLKTPEEWVSLLIFCAWRVGVRFQYLKKYFLYFALPEEWVFNFNIFCAWRVGVRFQYLDFYFELPEEWVFFDFKALEISLLLFAFQILSEEWVLSINFGSDLFDFDFFVPEVGIFTLSFTWRVSAFVWTWFSNFCLKNEYFSIFWLPFTCIHLAYRTSPTRGVPSHYKTNF